MKNEGKKKKKKKKKRRKRKKRHMRRITSGYFSWRLLAEMWRKMGPVKVIIRVFSYA